MSEAKLPVQVAGLGNISFPGMAIPGVAGLLLTGFGGGLALVGTGWKRIAGVTLLAAGLGLFGYDRLRLG